MSPGARPDPRDPRRQPPTHPRPEAGGRSHESVVWEPGAVRQEDTPVRDGGLSEGGAASPKRCPHCEGEYDAALMFCPRDGAVLRAPSVSDDLTGQIVADRYRVLRKLGQGGMGQVYLAEHARMGRLCAIKVMSPALLADSAAIARFDREASNASRITHPGVAAIYDFGEASDGVVYLAMEYVDGEPLTRVLQREPTLSIHRALGIARQIADALSAAHALTIIHRDLKPDNIMVARNRDGSDCVKVVDFGISKGVGSVSQELTATGLIIGTPAYMSPEQLAGDPIDGRSDIYSLGLVLFHMLAGALPFASGQDGMLARLIAAPRRLAEIMPGREWPPELQALLDRMLAPAADDRFPTADAVALEIQRLLEKSRFAAPAAMNPLARRSRSRSIIAASAIIALGSAAALYAVGVQRDGRTAGALPSSTPAPIDSATSAERPGVVPAGLPRTRDETPGAGATAAAANAGQAIPADSPAMRNDRTARGEAISTIEPQAPRATPQVAAVVAPSLDSLEAWTSPSSGTPESARRALGAFPRVLPGLTTRNDSIAAFYYAAGAHIELGDHVAACVLLRRIEPRASAHPYLANAVAAYLADPALNCRK